MPVLFFKETNYAYLLKTSITHDENRIPLMYLLMTCIFVRSAPTTLSLRKQHTSRFSNFLITSFFLIIIVIFLLIVVSYKKWGVLTDFRYKKLHFLVLPKWPDVSISCTTAVHWKRFVAPWSSSYYYCTTSFNKFWTQIMHRLKLCSRQFSKLDVESLQAWFRLEIRCKHLLISQAFLKSNSSSSSSSSS